MMLSVANALSKPLAECDYHIAYRNVILPSVRAKKNVMTNILVLNSSVLGDGSVSKILVEEAVHRLLEANPGATLIHRDEQRSYLEIADALRRYGAKLEEDCAQLWRRIVFRI
jgi:hypothetical protein